VRGNGSTEPLNKEIPCRREAQNRRIGKRRLKISPKALCCDFPRENRDEKIRFDFVIVSCNLTFDLSPSEEVFRERIINY
jgi:hypothetical protein